jgi:hypothetical protein
MCATLESEGIRCWIAPRDVMPGMEWGRSIIEAIEQARIMVLLFTANANASPQIRREVERAVNHDVVILPFRVENILPDKSLEYFIGNVHWLDALTPPLEKHIERLVGTVQVLLTQVRPKEPQLAPQPRPHSQQEPEGLAPSQAPACEPYASSEFQTWGVAEVVREIPTQDLPPEARKAAAKRTWLFVALGLVVLICALLGGYYGLRPHQAGARWTARTVSTKG